ncbi:transposase [Anaerosphaera multitolerans]
MEKIYSQSMKNRTENRDILSPIFKFSESTRKVIYTNNAIESLNSSYRRLNRQRSVFPSDASLLKVLYLSTNLITKKWVMPLISWGQVYGEFLIMHEYS